MLQQPSPPPAPASASVSPSACAPAPASADAGKAGRSAWLALSLLAGLGAAAAYLALGRNDSLEPNGKQSEGSAAPRAETGAGQPDPADLSAAQNAAPVDQKTDMRSAEDATLTPAQVLDERLLRIDAVLGEWAAAHSGNYPSTLEALAQPDSAGRRFLPAQDLKDPWGQSWTYVAPSNRVPYQLYSLGRDGQPGGSGEDADRFIAELKPGE